MFSHRTKSALFIDYENVGSLCPPGALANWIAWLEDGQFDKNRRRLLLEKRVYWNPSAQQHEEVFKKGGFSVVLCEKHHRLKNGADIRIALDVAEMTIECPRIEEFILFTKDTDFVPVLQRLRLKKKKTAILADENQPRVYATYSNHADIVLPTRKFKEGPDYQRPIRWAGIKETLANLLAREAAPGEPEVRDTIDLAVNAVIRATSIIPNQDALRRNIEAELKKIAGFSQAGKTGYFGKGGYLPLMREVAARSDKIKLSNAQPKSDSVSVRYVPKDEEE
jgi:hypothetical protein